VEKRGRLERSGRAPGAGGEKKEKTRAVAKKGKRWGKGDIVAVRGGGPLSRSRGRRGGKKKPPEQRREAEPSTERSHTISLGPAHLSTQGRSPLRASSEREEAFGRKNTSATV